jgi:hypothetical protein
VTPEALIVLERLASTPWRDERFSAFNLPDPSPSSAPQWMNVTLPRDRVFEFRAQFNTLLAFVSVVLDVPPNELTPFHMMGYLLKKENEKGETP